MNIFADFNERIIKTVEALDLKDKDGGALDLSRIAVEPPRDASHGDLATNAAMVLAKAAGQNPRALAETIAASAAAPTRTSRRPRWPVRASSICRLERRLLAGSISPRMLDAGRDYGRSTIGAGSKVNVEYVSANPTGPMHVGHCRGAVVGDALANLLAFAGYDVTKEYLHQRRRRADRRAGALGHAALPRGARRRDRRDPGRPLSRRLSRAGRPGAGRANSAAACCRCRRTRRWPSSRTARSTP